MKTVKRMLCLFLAVLTCLSALPVMASASSSPAKLTNPSITPVNKSGTTYYGKYSGTVSNSSAFTVKWDSTETSFRLAIKVLSGEPNTSSFNDSGEDPIVNRMDDNRYTSKSYKLTASQMSAAAGKWIKVYIGTDNWNCHYYFKVAASSSSGPSDMEDVPSKPNSVTAETLSTSQIEISWKAVTGATKYKVYRSTSSSSSSASLIWTGTATSYTDSGLAEGSKYYYWVKATNGAGDSSFSSRDYAWTGEVAYLTSPSISPTLASTSTVSGVVSKVYYGKLSSAVACNDDGSFTVKWDNTDGEFRFAVKRLNGEPDISNLNAGKDVSESGTDILSYQTGRTTASYTIDADDISASKGKWIKVFIGGYGWNCHYYFKVTPKAGSDLELSKTSVTMDWGEGNEASVTVTGGSSYSVSVSYNQTKTGYDYEWLRTPMVSGSTITVRPNRPNYSASERSATVTVSSGGQSAKFTVTQKACGESAPSLTLKRGSTIYQNGSDIGTFTTGQSVMEIDMVSTNVRKVHARLAKSGETSLIATCSDLSKISFDISSLTAGKYIIEIWASNSDCTNDLYKQNAFSTEYMTLCFQMKSNTSSGAEDTDFNKLISTFQSVAADEIIDECENYVLKAIKYHLKNSTDAIGALQRGKSIIFIFDGCNVLLEDAVITEDGFYNYYKSSDLKKLNRSAVCIVVQNYDEPQIVYASQASTTADQVRGLNDGTKGRPVTVDGIHDLVTVNHLGSYAALAIKNFNVIRCTESVSKLVDGDQNGIHVHARKNWYLTESTADSTGCILIGQSIYSPDSNSADYNSFISTVTGKTNAINSTYSTTGTDVGVLVLDRTCYFENLPTIFGDDTTTGGIKGADVATGEDIAKEITRESIKWRETVMGSNDSIVASWKGLVVVPGKPQGGQTIELCEVQYNANGGSGAPETQNVKKGDVIAISNTEPIRSGYDFLGWANSEGASVAQYEAGDSYTVSESVTLYAVWKKNSSGGSGGGSSGSTQYEISGTITTYTSGGNVTLQLLDEDENEVSLEITRTGDYSFEVTAGSYTLIVSKGKHVTRVYELEVRRSDVVQNVEIYLLGDVTGDGNVTLADYGKILSHVKNKSFMTGYQLECADVNGDGKVTLADYGKVLSHVKKKTTLW